MKPIRTWVLIADGQRAHVLENTGPGKGLTEVAGLAFETHVPRGREIMSDRPGRSQQSASPMRSAVEPQTDPRREWKRRFLKEVADRLETALQAKSFERLVLIAPPTALGELRAALSAQVRAAVIAELDKDLTKLPASELPKHLEAVLVV
jgi:protein required for attachment to host cells